MAKKYFGYESQVLIPVGRSLSSSMGRVVLHEDRRHMDYQHPIVREGAMMSTQNLKAYAEAKQREEDAKTVAKLDDFLEFMDTDVSQVGTVVNEVVPFDRGGIDD